MMHIVFGGAFQGKLDYCTENLGVSQDAVQTFSGGVHIDQTKKVYNKCHELVIALVKNGQNPVEFFTEHLNLFKDKILIFDEITCGVVPVDAVIRKAREENGRVMVYLCGQAENVTRIFCKIPSKVK